MKAAPARIVYSPLPLIAAAAISYLTSAFWSFMMCLHAKHVSLSLDVGSGLLPCYNAKQFFLLSRFHSHCKVQELLHVLFKSGWHTQCPRPTAETFVLHVCVAGRRSPIRTYRRLAPKFQLALTHRNFLFRTFTTLLAISKIAVCLAVVLKFCNAFNYDRLNLGFYSILNRYIRVTRDAWLTRPRSSKAFSYSSTAPSNLTETSNSWR